MTLKIIALINLAVLTHGSGVNLSSVSFPTVCADCPVVPSVGPNGYQLLCKMTLKDKCLKCLCVPYFILMSINYSWTHIIYAYASSIENIP